MIISNERDILKKAFVNLFIVVKVKNIKKRLRIIKLQYCYVLLYLDSNSVKYVYQLSHALL